VNTGKASRVIVALDYAQPSDALALVKRLDPSLCGVKVGKELFVAAGPDLVREIVALQFNVFLDLKFHDIPNTVSRACAAATRLGVWMLNVHASGGVAMMQAARRAVDDVSRNLGRTPPLLLAVTVLTSLGADDLVALGFADPPAEQSLRLARLAQQCGLDGVVCSAQEAALLRGATSAQFKLVTPGIRPAGDATHDQVRLATPQSAIAAGADYLVIGRSITGAPDPRAVLESIHASLPLAA